MSKASIWLISAIALVAQGQDCPWINRATASAILRGEASVEIHDGSCVFQANGSKLHIEVATSLHAAEDVKRAQSRCESGPTPLAGIGNAAFVCTVKAGVSAQVAGRVRDQVFVITATANQPTAINAISERARSAASQVSGILY